MAGMPDLRIRDSESNRWRLANLAGPAKIVEWQEGREPLVQAPDGPWPGIGFWPPFCSNARILSPPCFSQSLDHVEKASSGAHVPFFIRILGEPDLGR